MTQDHPTNRARETAAKVTRNSGSNLWFVGRLLTPARLSLFEACYASMRLIDDYVDDEFLCLPESGRDEGRDEANRLVEAWRAACENALLGSHSDIALPSRIQDTVSALADVPRPAKPPVEPWTALASAMMHDVSEVKLQTWDDFLSYCEGATVAPAAVFLHVLCAKDQGEAGLEGALDAAELFDRARPMAIFCYLTHIVRDIAKDAASTDQLLTIPSDLLATHGSSRSDIRSRGDGAHRLLDDLLARASDFRRQAQEQRNALAPLLNRREAMILDALLGIYDGIHEALSRDIGAALNGDSVPTNGIRRMVFDRLGLDRVSL